MEEMEPTTVCPWCGKPILMIRYTDNIEKELYEYAKPFARAIAGIEITRMEQEFEIEKELLIQEMRQKIIKEVRKDTAKRVRGVHKGKQVDTLLPWLKGCTHAASDMRPMGSPIDWVAFDDLYTVEFGGEIKRITLIEVKSGHSVLSPPELAVRDFALKMQKITRGMLSYELYNISNKLVAELRKRRMRKRKKGGNPQQ